MPTSPPEGSTSGPPDEPRGSGAVCSTAPSTRRPRGSRKRRPADETNPSVTRSPRPPGLARASTGVPIAGGLARLPAHRRSRHRCPRSARRGRARGRRPTRAAHATAVRERRRSPPRGAALWAQVSTLPVADHHPRAERPAAAESHHRRARALGGRPRSRLHCLQISHSIELLHTHLLVASDYHTSAHAPTISDRVRPATSPLAAALDSVGDRWTLLLIEALLNGPRASATSRRTLAGSPRTCSAAASAARGGGAGARGALFERPPRFVYELTASGRELAGALRLLADWGARHREGGEAPRHEACGTPVEMRWWCPTCERPVGRYEYRPDLRLTTFAALDDPPTRRLRPGRPPGRAAAAHEPDDRDTARRRRRVAIGGSGRCSPLLLIVLIASVARRRRQRGAQRPPGRLGVPTTPDNLGDNTSTKTDTTDTETSTTVTPSTPATPVTPEPGGDSAGGTRLPSRRPRQPRRQRRPPAAPAAAPWPPARPSRE